MIIQSLEQKTRLALTTVLVAVSSSVIICCFTMWKCFSFISEERSQIYVIDGDIPFLAERTKMETTFLVEAKAHIQLFHHYFFNLPPDNNYIEWAMGKAMYMADATALRQKKALEESGFLSDLVSSSAVATLVCDSISFDERQKRFTYYGTQLIKRKSNTKRRSLVTSGMLESVPRSHNNPHGLLITNWRTVENNDLNH